MANYNFEGRKQDEVEGVEEALRQSLLEYCNGQLGWSEQDCENRAEWKLEREFPKSLLDRLEKRRCWELTDSKVLDVGSGLGGTVLEACLRGADAHGVEPGQEFNRVSRMRLEEKGFDPERIHMATGEDLPFSSETFDYAINLYVLEHVQNPGAILKEINRVLKPGGELHMRCENYLSFWEPHYRVHWLPLLPKTIGSFYLRALGHDPSFLNNYVFYSTYPQICRLAAKVGFDNETHQRRLEKARTLDGFKTQSSAIVGKMIRLLPANVRVGLARWMTHAQNVFSVGVGLHLVKPKTQ
jgi:ubiquinone/menaquinone biosynthesis C-methylase UbiE